MRYCFVDAFRGAAVFSMLVLNLVSFFSGSVPVFLKHNLARGVFPGDLVAPCFLFLLGFCVALSVSRRRRLGFSEKSVFLHFLRRFLSLFFLGTVLGFFANAFVFSWGVLETLAFGVLFAYLAHDFGWLGKVLFSVFLLAVYYFLVFSSDLASGLVNVPQGGFLAVPAWSVLSVAGVAFGRLFLDNEEVFEKRLLFSGLFLLFLGFLLSGFDVSSLTVLSPVFVVLSIGFCVLFLLFFCFLCERKGFDLGFFRVFGKASLSVWVFQFLFVFYLNSVYVWAGLKPLGFAGSVFVSGVFICFFWFSARFLVERNLQLSL